MAYLGINEITTVEILDLLVEIKAVDEDLWKSRIIWCQNLVDNLDLVYSRRSTGKPQKPVIADNNLSSKGVIADDNYTSGGVSVSKSTHTKLNNTKLNNTIVDNGDFLGYMKELQAKELLEEHGNREILLA